MGGFACAELGKRIPIIRNIGAAAIFATFIPSFLAFHHLLPNSILGSVVEFTNNSNFLYTIHLLHQQRQLTEVLGDYASCCPSRCSGWTPTTTACS